MFWVYKNDIMTGLLTVNYIYSLNAFNFLSKISTFQSENRTNTSKIIVFQCKLRIVNM